LKLLETLILVLKNLPVTFHHVFRRIVPVLFWWYVIYEKKGFGTTLFSVGIESTFGLIWNILYFIKQQRVERKSWMEKLSKFCTFAPVILNLIHGFICTFWEMHIPIWFGIIEFVYN